ncbi:MAG: T9SS type A sorting domain-containing protein [Flavobacteriales bacterium]
MRENLLTILFTISVIFTYAQHPTNLTETNITSNSTDLSWDASVCSASVIFKYRTTGGSWNANVNNVSSPYILSGLAPNTSYDWTVKCSGTSGWSSVKNFTTLSGCNLTSSISITDASCDNIMNGSVDLTINNGVSPYTFAWDNGSTTEDLSGVSNNTYIVQVTDNNGCNLSDTAVVGVIGGTSISQSLTGFDPNPLNSYQSWSYDTLNITNTGCNVRIRPDFIITCDAGPIQQGNFVLRYYNLLNGTWPSIPYNIDANGNAYGFWNLISTDSTGTNITYGQIQDIIIKVKFLNPANTGTYTCTWNTKEVDNQGNTISTLSSSTTSLTLVNCSTFSIDSTSSSNVSCNGGSDGSATIFSILNGSGSYSYLWSNGNTDSSITNLSVGTYSVVVTDNNWGCIDSTAITITQPDTLTALLTGTNISCNGMSDGTLNASGMGGAGQYDIIWVSHPGLPPVPNQTNLAPDTYIIDVIDLNCGDISSASYTLTEPSALIISTSSANNTSCDTANCNGNITISLSGGTQPYSYMWTNGYTDSIRNDLCGATYTIDATDVNSCITFTENIIIYDSSFTPSALVTGTNISCNGMSDGSASTMISTGAGSSGGNISTLTYCASSPGTNSYANIELVRIIGDGDSIVNNTAGTCDTYEDYTSQYTSLTPGGTYSIDVNLGTCDVTGGTIDSAGIFIDWNIDGDFTDPGEMVGVFGGVQSPTSHTISFIVPNGYYGATRMRVISQAQMNNTGFPDGPVSPCVVGDFGALGTYNQPWYGATEDYSIVIVGVVPATYLWSTGDTTNIISNLSVGTYYCEVTDTNNCSATDTIIITEPDLISATELTTNVNCNGGSDGTATLTISGGTLPYISNWNAADTNNLSVGIYTYTITDNNNCTFSDSINISEPIALTNSYTSANITCNGASTGNIDITPFGGISPYTFSWDNGVITEDLTNVSAGQYIVNITDTNSCTLNDTITLTEPSLLYSSFTQTNVSCYGLNDGSATVNIFGGVTDYILSWDTLTYPLLGGISVFTTPVGVPAGIYPFMVTDNNGCIMYDTITITAPSQIVSTPTITNVSCYGLSDGSTSLSISGGLPSYIEDWGLNNPLSLSAGTYNYSITDGNSCILYDSVTITEPNVLDAISTITNVSCFGIADGAATVNISGGTTDYMLFWDTLSYPLPGGLSTFITPIGVPAGTYPFSITDNNGCSFSDTIIISQPTVISVSETISNVSCNGGNDGTATLTLSGGTGTLTENWGTNNPMALAAGTYPYTVNDNNGCSFTGSVTITEPLAITSSILITDLNSCLVADGSIDLTPDGGVSPYTYLWSNNDTTQDISTLSAGNYTVTITDANGCLFFDSATVNQPSNGLTLSLSSPSYNGYNIPCFDDNTGSIIANSSGGIGILTYSWSNGDTTQNISNLSDGSYSVTMTDAVGCSLFDNITLNEPSEISSIYSTTNVLCNGDSTGSATVVFSGGVTDYLLSWTSYTYPLPNGLNTFVTPFGVPAGIYPYSVIDVNGCLHVDTITITEPNDIDVTPSTTNVSCHAGNDGTVTLNASGGTGTLVEDWGTANPIQLSEGTYNYTITDDNQCTYINSVTITEPLAISVSPTTTDVSCNGGNDGTSTLNASGGTGTLVEDWGTVNSTQLSVGTYNYTITDDNQCTYINSVTITEPSEIIISIDSITDVSVYGGNDGSIYISSNGGVGNNTYNWNGPSGYSSVNEDIIGIYSGNYIITVTDSTNCSTNDTVIINQPPSLSITLDSVTNLLCYGECNGSLSITADGGDSVYTYLWTGPNGFTSTDEDIDSLCAGSYELILSDTTDSISVTFAVSQETQLSIITNTNVALCYGGTAQATAYSYGGQYPYQTLWNNGSTSISTQLVAGTHYVTVADSNGCIAIDSVTILQNDSIGLSTSNTNISCFGLNDGTISINVNTGGISPFTYSDNNGQSFQNSNTFSNLGDGNYTFIVMDVNGCTNDISSNISEPSQISIILNSTVVSCYGECDGTASSILSGGTAPYNQDWGGLDENNLCAGLVNLLVTDNNGCLATQSVLISEPNPVVVTISVNGSEFEATSGFVTYQWIDGNGNLVIGANSDTLIPTSDGEYAVVVTDSNGCEGISDYINYIIEAIDDVNSTLSIYPNPTNGHFTIETDVYFEGKIKIYSSFGSLVYSINKNEFTNGKISLDLTKKSKGIYIIQLINNQTVINHRIVLQ